MRLSLYEREALFWAGEGLTAKEIAKARAVSLSTIETQIYSAIRKLGARNRTHAVAIMLRAELGSGVPSVSDIRAGPGAADPAPTESDPPLPPAARPYLRAFDAYLSASVQGDLGGMVAGRRAMLANLKTLRRRD